MAAEYLPFGDDGDKLFAGALLQGRDPLSVEAVTRRMDSIMTRRNVTAWLTMAAQKLKRREAVELVDIVGVSYGTLQPSGIHTAPAPTQQSDQSMQAECRRIAKLTAELTGPAAVQPEPAPAPTPRAETFSQADAERIAELTKTLPQGIFKKARLNSGD
jgi:hypothetical protein